MCKVIWILYNWMSVLMSKVEGACQFFFLFLLTCIIYIGESYVLIVIKLLYCLITNKDIFKENIFVLISNLSCDSSYLSMWKQNCLHLRCLKFHLIVFPRITSYSGFLKISFKLYLCLICLLMTLYQTKFTGTRSFK